MLVIRLDYGVIWLNTWRRILSYLNISLTWNVSLLNLKQTEATLRPCQRREGRREGCTWWDAALLWSPKNPKCSLVYICSHVHRVCHGNPKCSDAIHVLSYFTYYIMWHPKYIPLNWHNHKLVGMYRGQFFYRVPGNKADFFRVRVPSTGLSI